MFKTKNQLNPTISTQKLQSIAHQHRIRFSKHSFYEPNRKAGFLKSAIQTNNTQPR